MDKLKEARLSNKDKFDKTHRLRTKGIQIGDWVLVFDSSLEHQRSIVRKFSRRWFGLYVVVATHNNAIYTLRELDDTVSKILTTGKRIKAFRRRDGRFYSDDIAAFDFEERGEIENRESETEEDGNLHDDEDE